MARSLCLTRTHVIRRLMSDKENQSENQQSDTIQNRRDSDYNPGRDLPDLDYETYRKSEDYNIRERDYENHRTSK